MKTKEAELMVNKLVIDLLRQTLGSGEFFQDFTVGETRKVTKALQKYISRMEGFQKTLHKNLAPKQV